MSGKCSLLLLLFGLLAACHAPLESGSSAISTPTTTAIITLTSAAVAPATSPLVPSPSLTPTPSPTRYATRRPRLTSTTTNTPPTRTPTIRPTSALVVAAPPGLIYSSNGGQWRIAADGKPTLIITGTRSLISPNGQLAIKPCCYCVCAEGRQLVDLNTGQSRCLPFDYQEIVWSPDSQYIYYITNHVRDELSDIWRWNVVTGEKRNLTHTPDLDERWWLYTWPQRPNTLVFYSTEGFVDGEGYIGYLTTMQTDGSGYKIVSQLDVSSPAVLSPDGQTIAYDSDGPWYYQAGSQPQRFPWKNFGLAKFKTMRFSSPSWSPDGQKIAWWMGSDDRPNGFDGIGLFDLQKGHVALLDNLTEVTLGGWPDTVKWSPDGKRIAFFGGRQQSEKHGDWGEFGIWTAQADGSHLRRLIDLSIEYNVCDWAWQPDGQWLAISCREHPEILLGIWLAELETGKLLKTNLPDDAEIRGWVNPRP